MLSLRSSYRTLLVGAVLACGFSRAQGQFCPATDALSAGYLHRPYSIAAAPLDADALVDIVAVNDVTDDVSVLLATSPGVFAPAQLWPVGDEPVAVRLVDLDQDGHLDIVTANHTSNDVSILINDGNGAFSAPTPVPVGQAPIDVVAIHLDADGDFDLVTANAADGTISVLVNQGGASFEPAVPYPSGNTPNGLDVCDMDGDTWPDVVVGHQGDGTIAVFESNGDGTLQPAQSTPLSSTIFDVICCDVDGVLGPDVVTVDGFLGQITLLLNDGTGTPVEGDTFGSAVGGFTITCVDLDCDGWQDVVTGNVVTDDLTVFFNQGGAQFDSTMSIPTGENPSGVAGVDVDGDDAPDLLAADLAGITLNLNACPDCQPVGVAEHAPASIGLQPPSPNPASANAQIAFTLSRETTAKLDVYDARGRRVRTLLHDRLSIGDHRVAWDGRDAEGRPVPSGVYFYRLTTDAGVQSRRGILVR